MPQMAIETFSGSLKTALKPLYLIHGEEDLLRLEAVDELRDAAKTQGYTRETALADSPQFDWNEWLVNVQSAGLFADLKLAEIHIPNGKLGKQGSESLTYLANNPPPDTVIVIILPKLDKAQTQSKWFSAISKNGVVLDAKPIIGAALIAWINERLQRYGLQAQSEAITLFAERVEGNLLAARQEIDKLALLYPQGHLLTIDDAEQAIANVARFDVFQLSSAWMTGDTRRVARLLDGLAAEGEEPVLLVWALAEDIRTLIKLTAALKQGKSVQSVRNELRLWGDKQHSAPKAVARLSLTQLIESLQICAQIDRQIKGAENGDAWTTFRQLILKLAT